MKTFKQMISRILFLSVFAIIFSSCGSMKDENTRELKNQVNALQTQNALLQEELASRENQVEDPEPPTAEPLEAEFIEITPTSEILPTTPVPAGQPIIYDGWAITVSKELYIQDFDNSFGISIYVRNLGDSSRVFRYMHASVEIKDDIGTTFEMVADSHCEEYLHLPMNLQVTAGESVTVGPSHLNMYCSRAGSLTLFQGPIPLAAQQLLVHFSDFGPFNDVDVVIDL